MGLFSKKTQIREPEKDELLETSYQSNLMSSIASYRNFKQERKNRYKTYREMAVDAIISSALDLYASDATQTDLDRQHSVWIECSNPAFKSELEDFLYNVFRVEEKIYTIAHGIAQFGEVYLQTFDTTGAIKNDERVNDWFFEIFDKSELLYPLLDKGEITGYYLDDKNNRKVYPKSEFIPFISDYTGEKEYIELTIQNSRGEQRKVEYKSVVGSSYLKGSVVAWQVLKVLEDVLLLTRVGKSSVYRLIKVEVGNATKKEAQEIIEKAKKVFKTRETINLMDNAYQSRNEPIASQENIYVPTRNGVGNMEISTIGGDYDLKTALDLDYFKNKLFASLRIPKAYLGFDGESSSVLGDNSITRLDERYARTVKRLQNTVRTGIYNLLAYYIECSGRSIQNVPEFRVCMTPISSAEEKTRREDLDAKVATAESIVRLAVDNFPTCISKEGLFNYIFNDVLGLNTSQFTVLGSTTKVTNYGLRGSGYGDNSDERRFINITPDMVTDMDSSFEEYNVHVEIDGNVLPLTEAVMREPQILNEVNYKQLKQRVQATDPDRVRRAKKLTTTYMGLNRNGDAMFRTTSETTPGKYWYQTVRFLELPELVDVFRDDKDVTDRDIVAASVQGDIAVYSDDPSFKYYWQWMATQDNYSIQPEHRAPTRNNLELRGAVDKHTYVVLSVLPFWTNRIVSDLRKQFFRQRPTGTKAAHKTDGSNKSVNYNMKSKEPDNNISNEEE